MRSIGTQYKAVVPRYIIFFKLSEAGDVAPIHHVEAQNPQGNLTLILQDMQNQINALMKNRDKLITTESPNLCSFHRTFGN